MFPLRSTPFSKLPRVALVVGIAAAVLSASAQEAALRKTLAERLPGLPKIDEISKTPIPGLYEVRIGTHIFYSDEQGNYVLEGGDLVDTRTRASLTEERKNKLTAIDPSKLPLKDAIVTKQGNGSRKLVVFADPNCGYCKQFERDLERVRDVTVYTYLYPILGPDSAEKSRSIWCARDSAKVWRDWMVAGVAPVKAPAACDVSALARNVELGRRHNITGTPALVFEDGKRIGGAIPAPEIEKQFAASRASKG